jgi:hypothetical protein
LELLCELRAARDLQLRQALLGGSMLLLGQTTSTSSSHHPWTNRAAVAAAGSPAQHLHDLIQMQSQQQQLGFGRTGASLYYPTAAAAATDRRLPNQLLETLGGLGGDSSRSQGFIGDPSIVSSSPSSSSYLLEQQQEQERSELRRQMLLLSDRNELLRRQIMQQQQGQGGVIAQDPHNWIRMERPSSIVAAGLLGQEDDTIVRSQEGGSSRGGQK